MLVRIENSANLAISADFRDCLGGSDLAPDIPPLQDWIPVREDLPKSDQSLTFDLSRTPNDG